MRNFSLRTVVVLAILTIVFIGAGKFFDSRCEPSCLMAAGRAAVANEPDEDGVNFRIGPFVYRGNKSSNPHNPDFDIDIDIDGHDHERHSNRDQHKEHFVSYTGAESQDMKDIALPSLENVDSIEILSVSAELEVKQEKTASPTTMTMRAFDFEDDSAWTYGKEGKTLKIDIRQRGPDRASIVIPEAFKGALKLQTVSGDVSLSDKLAVSKLQLNSTSGSMRLAAWPSEQIDITGVSADFESTAAAHSKSPKIINIKSVSGDYEINLPSPFEALDIETVSGDVRLTLPKNAAFHYRFHSISGDFKGIKGGILKDGIANKRMEGTFGNPKKANLTYESVSGDFTLH